MCKAMNTKLGTLDFILGWLWRLLNGRGTGSEVCFRKIIVVAPRQGTLAALSWPTGQSAECCTPTCRGRAAGPKLLPASFPAPVLTRRSQNSASLPGPPPSGWLVCLDATPCVTSALSPGSLESKRATNSTFAPAPRVLC